MRFFFTALLLGFAAVSFAQDPADIFHQTVDLDSITELSFDVYKDDALEFRNWPGDDILIETSVKINNGEPFMLDFFREQNRWDLKQKQSGSSLLLVSNNKTRQPVKSKNGSLSSETVRIVVYVPEDFVDAGANRFQRQGK